jgi:hypothetical protein
MPQHLENSLVSVTTYHPSKPIMKANFMTITMINYDFHLIHTLPRREPAFKKLPISEEIIGIFYQPSKSLIYSQIIKHFPGLSNHDRRAFRGGQVVIQW